MKIQVQNQEVKTIKKLRKGDEVLVVAGKDKGKKGKIEKVISKAKKVVIPELNAYKRHIKARTQNQKSEIITIIKPLPIANVALVCPKCKNQTRVGFNDKGERVCRKCKKEI